MPPTQRPGPESLPVCSICCDTLGACGGPATLPCGHNGCKDCLVGLQLRPPALCPLCRQGFDPRLVLSLNTELRDLIELASSVFMDDTERELGWEAFPDRARTAEEYAADLKLGRVRADGQAPSAPPAPHVPGADIVASHQQVMDLTPLPWLPDSWATSCGACRKPFRALTRLRHHCRCCGKIFCGACSTNRSLLPPRFNCRTPQRVCDNCAAMLAPLQTYLAATMAAAAQPPVHDAVLDSVSLRAWVNMPYCASLEQDVYKAANVLAKFTQTARLQPEAAIPGAVLAGASGLVIMSLAKLGAGWSATFGTGLVVSRSSTGQWSAPCAVAVAGVGWGLQLGGELTDLLLVLRTPEAVRACCGSVQLGLGGSMGLALGPVGRSADASLMLGSTSLLKPGAAYAYSCTQGAFIGVSLEGSLMSVRDSVNHAFYGLPVTSRSLLLERSVVPPPAAAALYDALHTLMRKYEVPQSYYTGPALPPSRRSLSLTLGFSSSAVASASAPTINSADAAAASGQDQEDTTEASALLQNPGGYGGYGSHETASRNQPASNVVIEELLDSTPPSTHYGGYLADAPAMDTAAARYGGGSQQQGAWIAGAIDAGYGAAAEVNWLAGAPSAPTAPVPRIGNSSSAAAQESHDDEVLYNIFDS